MNSAFFNLTGALRSPLYFTLIRFASLSSRGFPLGKSGNSLLAKRISLWTPLSEALNRLFRRFLRSNPADSYNSLARIHFKFLQNLKNLRASPLGEEEKCHFSLRSKSFFWRKMRRNRFFKAVFPGGTLWDPLQKGGLNSTKVEFIRATKLPIVDFVPKSRPRTPLGSRFFDKNRKIDQIFDQFISATFWEKVAKNAFTGTCPGFSTLRVSNPVWRLRRPLKFR